MNANDKLRKVDAELSKVRARLTVLLKRKRNICEEVIAECENQPWIYAHPDAIARHRGWDIEAIDKELKR